MDADRFLRPHPLRQPGIFRIAQSARQEKVYAKRELELDYFPGISYQACTMGEKEALLGDGSLVSRLSRKIGGKLFPASRKVFQETQSLASLPSLTNFRYNAYCCIWFPSPPATCIIIIRFPFRFGPLSPFHCPKLPAPGRGRGG